MSVDCKGDDFYVRIARMGPDFARDLSDNSSITFKTQQDAFIVSDVQVNVSYQKLGDGKYRMNMASLYLCIITFFDNI